MDSNAGTELLANQFSISTGFSDMYKRAQAIQESSQRMEQQKVRAADDHAISMFDQTKKANDLTEYNNGEEARRITEDNRTRQLELNRVDLKRQGDDELAAGTALTGAGNMAKEWATLPENDPIATTAWLNKLHSKYDRYLKDPKYEARFSGVLGGVIASGGERIQMAATSLDNDAGSLLQKFEDAAMRVNTSSDADKAVARQELSAIMRDPSTAKARRSAGPQGKALNDFVLKFWKDDADFAQATATAKIAKEGVVRAAELKAGGGKRLTDTLVSSTEKIVNAYSDLVNVKARYDKDASISGPLVGWARDMNPWKTDAAALSASITALIPTLARGVFGEVGVLTDADIKQYRSMLPTTRSPEAAAKVLFEFLSGKLVAAAKTRRALLEGQGYNTGGIIWPEGTEGGTAPKSAGSAVKPEDADAEIKAIEAELARRAALPKAAAPAVPVAAPATPKQDIVIGD